MDKTYCVDYYTPKGHRACVETTKHGVDLLLAQAIAKESNEKYKPLLYVVREFKV